MVAGYPAGTFPGVTQEKARRVTIGNAFELNAGTGAVTGAGLSAAIAAAVSLLSRSMAAMRTPISPASLPVTR